MFDFKEAEQIQTPEVIVQNNIFHILADDIRSGLHFLDDHHIEYQVVTHQLYNYSVEWGNIRFLSRTDPLMDEIQFTGACAAGIGLIGRSLSLPNLLEIQRRFNCFAYTEHQTRYFYAIYKDYTDALVVAGVWLGSDIKPFEAILGPNPEVSYSPFNVISYLNDTRHLQPLEVAQALDQIGDIYTDFMVGNPDWDSHLPA